MVANATTTRPDRPASASGRHAVLHAMIAPISIVIYGISYAATRTGVDRRGAVLRRPGSSRARGDSGGGFGRGIRRRRWLSGRTGRTGDIPVRGAASAIRYIFVAASGEKRRTRLFGDQDRHASAAAGASITSMFNPGSRGEASNQTRSAGKPTRIEETTGRAGLFPGATAQSRYLSNSSQKIVKTNRNATNSAAVTTIRMKQMRRAMGFIGCQTRRM